MKGHQNGEKRSKCSGRSNRLKRPERFERPTLKPLNL